MIRSHRHVCIFKPFWFLVVASIVVVLPMISGCGNGHPKCVGVRGIVTYQGKPVDGAGVTFMPKGARPAAGQTDAEGRFVLTTFTAGDGVAEGEHIVCINKSIPHPKDIGDSPYRRMISVLPACYSTPLQSPLRATVTAKGPNEFHFDLR